MCRDYGDHVGHKVILVQKVAAKWRDQLTTALQVTAPNLAKATSSATLILDQLDGVTNSLASNLSAPVYTAVRTEFDALCELLRKRQDQIFGEISQSLEVNRQQLQQQSQAVNGFISRALTATDVARKLLQEANDETFVLSAKEALDALTEVNKVPNLSPVTTEIKVQFADGDKFRREIPLYGKLLQNRTFDSKLEPGEDLVVKSKIILAANRWHEYRNVIIKAGGLLTIASRGSLLVRASASFIVEERGEVNVNGQGSAGGRMSGVSTTEAGKQGDSMDYPGAQSLTANHGGGGGGQSNSTFGSSGGGGGGYGTAGANAAPNIYKEGNPGGAGGEVYGDFSLNTLCIGSGGGSGGSYHILNTGGAGGAGGGAIHVHAAHLQIQGSISADGQPGESGSNYTSGGGGGSGGSIFLQARSMTLSGKVSAIGGAGGKAQAKTTSRGGTGGAGRIRLDYDDGEASILAATLPPVGYHTSFSNLGHAIFHLSK